MVRPGKGTADTRRLAIRDEIGEANWTLVARLSDARLVISGRDTITGIETVEVVHEALIREWKKLAAWMEENREFRLWQERLRSSLHQWEATGQSSDALLRGKVLDEAKTWVLKHPQDLSETERVFLGKSMSTEMTRLREQGWGGFSGADEELHIKLAIYKLRGCLFWFLAVLVLPLFARFVLQFLGADSSNIFTGVLNAFTGVILYPFHNILTTAKLNGHQVEWSTIVGIVVYWFLFLLIVNFLQLLLSAPQEEEVEPKYHRSIMESLAFPRIRSLFPERTRKEQERIKDEHEKNMEREERIKKELNLNFQVLTLLGIVEKEENAFWSELIVPNTEESQL